MRKALASAGKFKRLVSEEVQIIFSLWFRKILSVATEIQEKQLIIKKTIK